MSKLDIAAIIVMTALWLVPFMKALFDAARSIIRNARGTTHD